MQSGQPLEAVITSGLQHPNVLRVLDHAWQSMHPFSPSVRAPVPPFSTSCWHLLAAYVAYSFPSHHHCWLLT